jgi:hypothetical protein
MRAATLAVLLAGCTANFDSPSLVRDRRILGLSAEPPELTPGAVPAAVTVRALVADVADVGTTEFAWSSCEVLPSPGGPVSTVAPCGDAGVAASQGAAPVGELSEAFGVPGEVVAVLHSGVSGVAPQWQIELDISSDAGVLVAVKKVTLTPSPVPGQGPNSNPELSGLTFDGMDWPADAPLSVPFDMCAPDKRVPPAGEHPEPGPCTHEIAPVVDPSQAETFVGPGPSGDPEQQTETLTFDWFSDQGSFGRESTARLANAFSMGAALPMATSTTWNEPGTKPASATFWVVVRDGRGGESWLRRELVFP